MVSGEVADIPSVVEVLIHLWVVLVFLATSSIVVRLTVAHVVVVSVVFLVVVVVGVHVSVVHLSKVLFY